MKKLLFIFTILIFLASCSPAAAPGSGPKGGQATGAAPAATQPAAGQATPAPQDTSFPGGDVTGKSPALVWERSGGIAGICRTFTVNHNGEYLLVDCAGGQTPVTGQLTEEQAARLNALLERYGTVQWESKAAEGSADMFHDEFTLYGAGNTVVTDTDIASINETIAALVDELLAPIQ